MTHRVPKEIQRLLIEQFNFDMKGSPTRIRTEAPINDNECTLFSNHVAEVTETEPLHINTWKRVFERLVNSKTGEPYESSDTTCQIIAEFLGCESWSELEAQKDTMKPGQKRAVSEIVPQVEESTMAPGDTLEIQYGLDRKLSLVYRGDTHYNFQVKKTSNTKFEPGDLVHVPFIKIGESLNGWEVKRNGIFIGHYNSAKDHLINEKHIIKLPKD